jgi:hypothetical protein
MHYRPYRKHQASRFVDLETGEIIEAYRLPAYPVLSEPKYRKARYKSNDWDRWLTNLVRHFALIAILGLLMVVIVVMGK